MAKQVVYLVILDVPYEFSRVEKVFSTREKAEEWIENHPDDLRYLEIYEVQVDED